MFNLHSNDGLTASRVHILKLLLEKTYAKNQHKAQWWQSAAKTQFDTLKIN